MPRSGGSLLIRFQLLGIAALLIQGCGAPLKGTSTPCGSGTAQIDVYDAFMMRTCGCQEGSGAQFVPGQNLVCTVKIGTKVFFTYPNIVNQHQIAFGLGVTGSATYHNPQTNPQANLVDAITLNSTSSGITFTDQFTGGGGTFIVQ